MSDYTNFMGLLVLFLLVTALVMANNSMNEASRANERLDTLATQETDDTEVGEEMLRKILDDDINTNLRIVDQSISTTNWLRDLGSIGLIFFRTYEVNEDGTSRKVGENELYKEGSTYRTDVEYTTKGGTKLVVQGATTYRALTVPLIIGLGKNGVSADVLLVEGYSSRFRIAYAQRLETISVEIDQVPVQLDSMYSFYLDQRDVGQKLVVSVETRDGISLSTEYGIQTETTHLNFSEDSVMPISNLEIPTFEREPVCDTLVKYYLGQPVPRISVAKKNSEDGFDPCTDKQFQNGGVYRIELECVYNGLNGQNISRKLYGESMASIPALVIVDADGGVIRNLDELSAPAQLKLLNPTYWRNAVVTFGQDSFEIPESGVFDIVETCDFSKGFDINLKSKYEQPLLRHYESDLYPGLSPDIEIEDTDRPNIETQ
jgi:hypothetical protein